MRTNATRCHIWTYSIHVRMIWHAWYGKICVKMFDGPLEPFLWRRTFYAMDFLNGTIHDSLLHGKFSCFSYFSTAKLIALYSCHFAHRKLLYHFVPFCCSRAVLFVCRNVCRPYCISFHVVWYLWVCFQLVERIYSTFNVYSLSLVIIISLAFDWKL